jgi:Zn-dependent M28 family amino/carboxypeptidase
MKTKSFSRIAGFVTLAVALSAVIFGQQAKVADVAPSVERLREHVTYLASDALEGRRTGTTGANDAAEYIAGQFLRLGLRPGGQAKGKTALARFQQQFPYVAGVEPGKGNVLTLTTPLRVGEDWMPLGLSSNGRVDNASAVFVGYGIAASELNYSDYTGVDVAGKIAVALPGTPDGDNPHGQFIRYEDPRWKAVAARVAGAKALLVIAREQNFKDDRLSHLRYDNTVGDAGLPVAVISQQTAQRLFSGSTLADLEQTTRAKNVSSIKNSSGSLALATDIVRREVPARNIIGMLEGSEPTLKNEYIIIGAHYDHLGRGGAGSLAPREGEIHHGADDNASGVAGVLELARVLAAQNPKPRRSIVFIAFSGEEEGLLGSNYYANNPVVPLANTIAMINLDMVGRLRNRTLIIGGVGTAQEWRAIIEGANVAQAMTGTAGDSAKGTASLNKHPLVVVANSQPVVDVDTTKQFQLTLTEDGVGPSDHSSFYLKQIPVLFFWTGTHEDYHKPSDTADKINYIEEARIVGLIAHIVNALNLGKRPTYTAVKSESTGRSTGFRVYLGTIPNYADSGDGLLLDGVRDDSPAAKAGLKAGDRIVKLAGKDVKNVYDYTFALGEMKAGEEYEVEIVRGSERLKLKLRPLARR